MNLQNYYAFCDKHGIDTARFDPNQIQFEINKIVHTFHNRAAEIKEKYNHRFIKNGR
tara:strand:+ start:398 stop:568 length:171 start_codon:yes stop_codon:yes gene_type:complete